MLTINLWSTVWLGNGASGEIVDLIYDNDHCPPNLPTAVIGQFDDYSGPSFSESMLNCLPTYCLSFFTQDLYMSDNNSH